MGWCLRMELGDQQKTKINGKSIMSRSERRCRSRSSARFSSRRAQLKRKLKPWNDLFSLRNNLCRCIVWDFFGALPVKCHLVRLLFCVGFYVSKNKFLHPNTYRRLVVFKCSAFIFIRITLAQAGWFWASRFEHEKNNPACRMHHKNSNKPALHWYELLGYCEVGVSHLESHTHHLSLCPRCWIPPASASSVGKRTSIPWHKKKTLQM